MTRVSTARVSSEAEVYHHLLGLLPAGSVLNIGAGAGLDGNPEYFIVNVDHVPVRNLRVAVVADARTLPFPGGTFEAVLAKDVLEHVPDVVGLLRELRRVTTGGGRLVVSVPRAVPRAVWNDPTHVRGFTERALLTALRLGGWQPRGKARRLGGFPGAGRLHLRPPTLLRLMRVPGFGHRFGVNWLISADASDEPVDHGL